MYYLSVLCPLSLLSFYFFFFTDTAPPEIYTLSLHDALPISLASALPEKCVALYDLVRQGQHEKARELHTVILRASKLVVRSEEHTSELQSRQYLVCRLLLEKKKKNK